MLILVFHAHTTKFAYCAQYRTTYCTKSTWYGNMRFETFPQIPLSAVTRHTAHKWVCAGSTSVCAHVCLLWLMEREKRRSSRNGLLNWMHSPCQRLDPWDVILLPFRLKQSITVSRPVVNLAPSTTMNREAGETFLMHNNYCLNLELGHRRHLFS